MRLVLLGCGLLALAGVGSLVATPLPVVSLPWVLTLLLGAGLVAMAATGHLAVPTGRVAPGVLSLGAIFLLISLFSTRWPEYKLPWFGPLYGVLSSLQASIWGAGAGTFNPNQAGGVAAVIFALSAAAFLLRSRSGPRARRWNVGAGGLAWLALVVVALSGSRAAMAGAGSALLIVLVLRQRRWLWPVAGASTAGLVVIALNDRLLTRLAGVFMRDETLDTKLVARLDIWLSAYRGIEDHALTGIGLGVFNDIVPARYPYESVGLSYSVSQAHNVLLDTALTLGLPGLFGLLVLLAGMVLTSWTILRLGGEESALAGGILAAIAVYAVFGMTDALSFSSPFGFVLWILALTLALSYKNHERRRRQRSYHEAL